MDIVRHTFAQEQSISAYMEDKHGGTNNCTFSAADTDHHAYYNQEYDSEDTGRQWETGEFIIKVCACCGGGYCGCCNGIKESSCGSNDGECFPGELKEVYVISVAG